MEQVKIYARVLHTNVVGHTAFIQVTLRGVEFQDKKVPKDFPTQTLDVPSEFLIHFGNYMPINEEAIAQVVPDKFITLIASLSDDGELTIHKITATTPFSSTDITLAERLLYLKKMY